jgi:hypothetical protein
VADWGDKKQVGVMLTPEALALADGLGELRSGKVGPKYTRSDLIEALLWEEAKRKGIEPDARRAKEFAATLGERKAKGTRRSR